MRQSKALLPFGDEAMLARVVRLLGGAVPTESIVVVAARAQPLPALPAEVAIVYDETPDQGPLPALAAGLAALPAGVEIAFATACDAPLLRAAFVRRLFELLEAGGEVAVVAPDDGERLHPLAAAYHVGCAEQLQNVMAVGERSLHRALTGGQMRMRRVGVDELRLADPELASLVNCNTEEDCVAALAAAGFG